MLELWALHLVRLSVRVKWFIKRTAFVVAAVLVSPLVLVARAQNAWVGQEGFFFATACTLGLVPGLIGQYLRLAFYRLTLRHCSLEVCFEFGSRVNHPTAEIGRDVTIGGEASIGTATIGDHVLIGPRTSILSGRHQHDVWQPEQDVTDSDVRYDRVIIGSNSWIGERAVILADVGERCIVAAGAVLFRPAPAGKMVMGNPARVISREFTAGPTKKEPV